jgi:hypothetical protein
LGCDPGFDVLRRSAQLRREKFYEEVPVDQLERERGEIEAKAEAER